MDQQCPLCRIVLMKPSLWVDVTFENGWRQYIGVCRRCFQDEWREFKHDDELLKGFTGRDEQAKILHSVNISFCDSLAVQVQRVVSRMNYGVIVRADACVDRSYQAS